MPLKFISYSKARYREYKNDREIFKPSSALVRYSMINGKHLLKNELGTAILAYLEHLLRWPCQQGHRKEWSSNPSLPGLLGHFLLNKSLKNTSLSVVLWYYGTPYNGYPSHNSTFLSEVILILVIVVLILINSTYFLWSSIYFGGSSTYVGVSRTQVWQNIFLNNIQLAKVYFTVKSKIVVTP